MRHIKRCRLRFEVFTVGKGVEIDFSGFDELNERLTKLRDVQSMRAVKKRTLLRLGQVYLREAKRNTPVGVFQEVERNGKIYRTESEHMRRSWSAGRVQFEGAVGKVGVFNSASYASYVNDGHRQTPGRYVPILGKRLVKGFVDGLNMAEKAAAATEKSAKTVMEDAIKKHLEQWSNDTH